MMNMTVTKKNSAPGSSLHQALVRLSRLPSEGQGHPESAESA